MANEIKLRPEELYFLGTIMGAAYIDYDYIASMNDIQRNYEYIKKKCLLSLSRAQLIRERLNGEITVRPQVAQLLRTVFFGKVETSLEIIIPGDNTKHVIRRFHYLDGMITMVTQEPDVFSIVSVTEQELDRKICSAIGRHFVNARRITKLNKHAVTRMIVAKRAVVGTGSSGQVLFEQNGTLYELDRNDVPIGISDTEAVGILSKILKEE